MELEQLKQQWDILHARLDEQQIINKKLMENAVTQKIDFINSRNIFEIVAGILLIPFLLIVGKQKMIDDFLLFSALSIVIIGFPISTNWTFQFAKKMSLKGNIIDVEKFILKYKRYTYISAIVSYIFTIVFFIMSIVIYYDLFVQYNRLGLAIIAYSATFLFIVFIGTRAISRLKNLHQNISDLKEFEKE